MGNTAHPTVGIDDMAAYVPSLYLPIEALAEARGIEYAKLNKGLGLTAMAVPDVGEDAATMMANAVRELIEKNQLQPQQIGRMYLGTESALDGAKPTATYAMQMLEQYFAPTHGQDCFLHCDAVDLTFACIGAVDALQNTLDWVRGGADRIGIVVASDNAKYELGSTGEYTQGAGAVALLVKQNPRLLAFDSHWGVSTRAVYDFYKPLRKVKKRDLIAEALKLADRNHVNLSDLEAQLQKGITVKGVLDSNEQELSIHKDTPIFDGPYSNDCYQQRIKEALAHYQQQAGAVHATDWSQLVFHLPYAYQARRMFGEIFWAEQQNGPQGELLRKQIGMDRPERADFTDEADFAKAQTSFWRAVTKTPLYRTFVSEKIAAGEQASSLVGNVYAGSVFLALMSTLENAGEQLGVGDTVGFFAYGSGSKSKVFSATLQAEAATVITGFQLMRHLQQRQAIDYATYEQLHRQAATGPRTARRNTFYQTEMNEQGVRTYHIPQIVAAHA
ncbi:MAG: hydroxymethylglutaryl-CoA synthase [Bacteroidota bacterium]